VVRRQVRISPSLSNRIGIVRFEFKSHSFAGPEWRPQATEIESYQRTPEKKRPGERNGHSRFQVQLEEDGGSSTGTELDGDK